MVDFSIPLDSGSFYNFRLEYESLMLAGSRHISLDPQTASDIIKAFGQLGFSFITGCANGVDRSFRDALAGSDYKDKSIIACAFKKRAINNKGVFTSFVIPEGLHPKVALAKRTLWMAQRCSMLLLFPSSPIGKGSALAFKSVIMGNKPVFVVTETRPAVSDLYSVYPSSLFGITNGYWCLPPVYAGTGYCHESI